MKIPIEIQSKYTITDADTEMFLQMFDEPVGKILEVAAHDEPIANMLSELQYHVTGVDLREYNPNQDIKGINESPSCNYEYHRGDFCNMRDSFIKENWGTYDSIICLSAIEHFGLGTYDEAQHPYYDIIAMRLIWNMLKEDGTAYISVPFGKEFIELTPHWRVYNKESLRWRIVQDFDIEDIRVIVADDAMIGNKIRHRGDPITWEEANEFSGHPPHVSVLLKMRKTPFNRTVKDGR